MVIRKLTVTVRRDEMIMKKIIEAQLYLIRKIQHAAVVERMVI